MGSHMSSWERNRDEGKVRWNHVHGDSHPAIKPQNLYLTNNSGRIKLPKFKGVQPKRQTWRIQWPSWPTPWEFVTHGLACDDPSPFTIVFFFFHLFLLVGGYLLYNIVVVFVIHWHESAMDLHVFRIHQNNYSGLVTWPWVYPETTGW